DAGGTDVAGAPGSGIAQPAGGSGMLGWLSGAYKMLAGALPTTLGGHGGLQIEGVAVGTAVPVSAADGAQATIGTTTDASSANTLVGLLKNIKAALAGTLTATITGALPAGTNKIGGVTIAD